MGVELATPPRKKILLRKPIPENKMEMLQGMRPLGMITDDSQTELGAGIFKPDHLKLILNQNCDRACVRTHTKRIKYASNICNFCTFVAIHYLVTTCPLTGRKNWFFPVLVQIIVWFVSVQVSCIVGFRCVFSGTLRIIGR